MLRRCTTTLCAAASPGKFSFAQRLEELKKDPNSPLSGPEYCFMRKKLATYSSLQQTYAVKQTDVERARRAANMCGLEFTGKMPRKEV